MLPPEVVAAFLDLLRSYAGADSEYVREVSLEQQLVNVLSYYEEIIAEGDQVLLREV